MTDKPFIIDKDYEQRVSNALMEALMLKLRDPDTGVCIWRTGEIAQAMQKLTAMLLAQSPAVDTPMKLRTFTEEYAKGLRRQVKLFQEHFEKNGAPFPQYVVEGDLN